MRRALALFALVLVSSACNPTRRGSAVSAAVTSPGTAEPAGSRREPSAAELLGKPIDAGPDVQPLNEDQATGRDFLGSTEGGPLADVHFAYNLASLDDEARTLLSRHAQWLQQNPGVRVTIEGHCDERGTVEYNLALGDLRAQSVREYLVSLGIAADRLSPLSYGKEKPLDASGTDAAFSRNRRAHFVVNR